MDFGDLDDDLFDEKEERGIRSDPKSVKLSVSEPHWFNEECPIGLDLLASKYRADKLYKARKYQEASEAYMQSIEICPRTNYGFLRDIVDGAARSSLKSQNSQMFNDCLNRLQSMASCEDHNFAIANLEHSSEKSQISMEDSDITQVSPSVNQSSNSVTQRSETSSNLKLMIDIEPNSAHLWRQLGNTYGNWLKRICCYIKAERNYKLNSYESLDRFKEENLLNFKVMQDEIEKLLHENGVPSDSNIRKYISTFYADLQNAQSRRSLETTTFDGYWFPTPECLENLLNK